EIVARVVAVGVDDPAAEMQVDGRCELLPVTCIEPRAETVALSADILQQSDAEDAAVTRIVGLDPRDLAEDPGLDGSVDLLHAFYERVLDVVISSGAVIEDRG